MSLRSLEIFVVLQRGDRLQTSGSDVYRRLIVTSKVDPCAVGFKLSHSDSHNTLCEMLFIITI